MGALVAGMLGPNAVHAQCFPGPAINLVEPMVTVVDGPGDGAAEQEGWSSMGDAYLQIDLGNMAATFGGVTFELTRGP